MIGANLVVMRAVALVLVLCLTGPAVVTAVCEWDCARAHHHEVNAAPVSCHEHQPKTGTTVIASTTGAVCHREAEIPTAIMTANLNNASAPAVLQTSPVISFDLVETPAFVALASIRPPSLLPIPAIPLRI